MADVGRIWDDSKLLSEYSLTRLDINYCRLNNRPIKRRKLIATQINQILVIPKHLVHLTECL